MHEVNPSGHPSEPGGIPCSSLASGSDLIEVGRVTKTHLYARAHHQSNAMTCESQAHGKKLAKSAQMSGSPEDAAESGFGSLAGSELLCLC